MNGNKGLNTRAQHLRWEQADLLIRCLIKSQDYTLAAYVALGIHLGLRDSDLRTLTLSQLERQHFIIKEKKTGKERRLTVSDGLRGWINQFRIWVPERVLENHNTGELFTIQHFNRKLKIACKQHLKIIEGISTHTLRKTFGRRVYDNAADKGMALYKLCTVFSHSSPGVTKAYIGLTAEEIADVYLTL